MATLTLIPATRFEPAELHSTHPAPCALCGALWDEEEHLDTEVDCFDGVFYCMANGNGGASCLDRAKETSYRERAAAIVAEKVAEALDELADLDREFRYIETNSHDHPVTILDDLQTRMKAFGAGKDSGWRNGVMLEDAEAWKLSRLLEDAIFHSSWDLRWELGLHEKSPNCTIGPYGAGNRATQLARLGRASMNFSRYTQRTAKGEVA